VVSNRASGKNPYRNDAQCLGLTKHNSEDNSDTGSAAATVRREQGGPTGLEVLFQQLEKRSSCSVSVISKHLQRTLPQTATNEAVWFDTEESGGKAETSASHSLRKLLAEMWSAFLISSAVMPPWHAACW